MRIMALDYGSKTVGVAMTDPLMITAAPLTILRRDREKKLRRTYAAIEQLVSEYGVDRIVVGLPVNMDGSRGERAELSLEFAAEVGRRTGLEVVMWDERLTTVEARDIMSEAGLCADKQEEYVDSMAACIILREYMDYSEPR